MSKPKKTQDPVVYASNYRKASYTQTYRCSCGCGALVLGLHDENDRLFASAQFTPEEWKDVIAGIESEILLMRAN
jgi:hypothetical protein